MPALVKENDADPSRGNVIQVEPEWSLYSHTSEVMLPFDESVKVTVNGLGPDVGLPENAATGPLLIIDTFASSPEVTMPLLPVFVTTLPAFAVGRSKRMNNDIAQTFMTDDVHLKIILSLVSSK